MYIYIYSFSLTGGLPPPRPFGLGDRRPPNPPRGVWGAAAPQPGGSGAPQGAKNNIKYRPKALDVTKPYEFIGFGAMDVTKPYEFIGCGAKGQLRLLSIPIDRHLHQLAKAGFDFVTWAA